MLPAVLAHTRKQHHGAAALRYTRELRRLYPIRQIAVIDTLTYSLRLAADHDAPVIASWFPTRESALLWGGSAVPEPVEERWLADQFRSTKRYYVLVDNF